MKPVVAYVGIGSNLDDPEAQVRRAIGALASMSETSLVRASRLYRTVPWGRADQPAFVNAAAELATTLAPRALLDALLAIERAQGRHRDGTRWGPRTIDLDLLLMAGEIRTGPELELPHPRMFERSFVVEPLRLLLDQAPFNAGPWADLRRRLEELPHDPALRPWRPA